MTSAANDGAVVKLTGGPADGLRPWATRLWHLRPGTIEPNDAAQQLAAASGATIEEAQAALPPGPVARLEAGT